MAISVGDIIRSAMRKLGVLAAGEPLSASEAEDALEALQLMVDSWSTEALTIPVVGTVTHQLINNQATYTIGIWPEPLVTPPDTHIQTARPQEILGGFIRDNAGTDYDFDFINVDTYNGISRKATGARPNRLYIRKGWPLNTLLFDSLPYANEELHLTVLQPLSELLPALNLTEEINLPPGYKKALIYNLCLDLAPEWGKQVDSNIAIQAVNSKKWIKRNNARSIDIVVDRALQARTSGKGTYDINAGP